MVLSTEARITPWRRRRPKELWLLVPALVLVFGVIAYPLAYSIILGFSHYDIYTGSSTFTGLQNYANLFGSSEFWTSSLTTVEFALAVAFPATFLGILTALLLNVRFVGNAVVRTLFILPWALPWVVIGLLWSWVLNGTFGSLNGALYDLGLIRGYIPFLANGTSALLFTALAVVWRETPLGGILILSALQTLPRSVIEASRCDGAGRWALLRYIILPWVGPAIGLVLLLNLLYGLLQFDTIYMMTQGGPGSATEVLSIFLYQQMFTNLDLGSGAAISNLLGLITVALGVGMSLVTRAGPGSGEA